MLIYLCSLSSSTPQLVSVSVRSLLSCWRSNTRCWPNAGLMLAHRLRRWPSIKPALVQRFVFAGSQSVSLCCGESVSDSFVSSTFYCKGSQTRDIEPMLAKLVAYGITTNSLKLLLKSYLTNWQQRVKIDNATSEWKEILKGVPQGSILGPILFNIFINDMFHFITRADLVNYADDNTICSEQPTKQQVFEVLRAESNLAI